MKDSEYLYGTNYDADKLSAMTYTDALAQKIKWAQETIDKLLEIPYQERPMLRIKRIGTAIKFNQAMLDEMKRGKNDRCKPNK